MDHGEKKGGPFSLVVMSTMMVNATTYGNELQQVVGTVQEEGGELKGLPCKGTY